MLSQMRHDLWMFMALLYSQPKVEEEVSTQSGLEYLFDNPTGNENTLDFLEANELYLISESDLDDLICDDPHIEDDNFGYDHLDIDIDSDLW